MKFDEPAHLGRHRRFSHGVLGREAQKFRKLEEEIKEKNANSAAIEVSKPVEIIEVKAPKLKRKSPKRREPEQLEHHSNGALHFDIDPTTVAVAFGRFTELCRSFAFEYDVPPRLLARRLAELIHAQALR
jgi:hypothetical protein